MIRKIAAHTACAKLGLPAGELRWAVNRRFMFFQAKELQGFELGASDGVFGRVKDFYFDDENWTIRYIVADTGKWIPDRQVLISPYAISGIDRASKILRLTLSKRQIEDSPTADLEKPVSRQFEEQYHNYYSWPMYWYGPQLWGPTGYPQLTGERPWRPSAQVNAQANEKGDSHLRSVHEVCGYHLLAHDDQIGHVEDFVLSEEDWSVRYLVIDTRNWLPGKHVLLPTQWVNKVDWAESMLYVDLDRETIKNAPEFDSSRPITRDYETSLFEHYGKEAYWLRKGKFVSTAH